MCAERSVPSFEQLVSWGKAGALSCVLLGSARAAAESRVVDFSLNAPPECGSADQVRVAVEGLVHKAPPEALHATLSIRRTSDQYLAELRTERATLREISAPSCEAVVETATVILALAIDPSAERGAPTAPRTVALARAEPPLPRRERLRFRVGAGSTFDTSTLPHVGSGVRARTGVSARRWSAQLEFTYWLPATTWLAADANLGGRFTWWTLGMSGCVAPLAPRWLGVCLIPELGRLEGTGLGARTNLPAPATWFAVAIAPELDVHLSSYLVLNASAGLTVTVLGRHPFVLERSDEAVQVHRPGRLSGRAGLGLALIF